MVPGFFIAIEVSLQFSIDMPSAESINQPFSVSQRFLCVLRVSVVIKSKRPVTSACQTNQPFCMLSQFIRCHRTFARFRMLGHAQFTQGDQATEVLIAGAILN